MNPTLETIKKGQESFIKEFEILELDPEIRGVGDDISQWHTSFLISLFEGEVERLNQFVLPQVNLDLFEGKPLNDRNIVALAKATADGRQTDFVNDQIKHYQEIIDYLKSIV